MKLNKAQMHKRPTYETLVKDTILEPKDRIALPDREATILRKTQQLTRYDDAEFLDLEKDNEQIAKEKAQQATVSAAAGGNTGGSLGQANAAQPGPHQGHNFQQPNQPGAPGDPSFSNKFNFGRNRNRLQSSSSDNSEFSSRDSSFAPPRRFPERASGSGHAPTPAPEPAAPGPAGAIHASMEDARAAPEDIWAQWSREAEARK
jgi:hypothetical protein